MRPLRADVLSGNHHLPRQLVLYAQVPLVNFGLYVIGIHCPQTNVREDSHARWARRRCANRTWVDRHIEPRGQAHAVGGGAVRTRRDRVVDQEGRVQEHLVFTAGALKQHVKTPIAGTHDGAGEKLIREPDTRGKIVLVRLHQRTPNLRSCAARRGVSAGTEQRPDGVYRGGIRIQQVGHTVRAAVRPRGVVITQAEVEGQLGREFPIVLHEFRQHP